MADADRDAIPDSLHVMVVTPLGPVVADDTDAVTAPGQLGELEVLPGHVPLLAQLHPGVLVLGEKRARRVFAVSSGFLEVEPDGEVQILVEMAIPASGVDEAAARTVASDLGPKLKEWKGALDAEYQNLKARYDWAQAQLDARSRA